MNVHVTCETKGPLSEGGADNAAMILEALGGFYPNRAMDSHKN